MTQRKTSKIFTDSQEISLSAIEMAQWKAKHDWIDTPVKHVKGEGDASLLRKLSARSSVQPVTLR